MSFGADIANFAKEAMGEADKKRRAITLEFFSSVIEDTPVLSGRARASWQFTLEKPSNVILPPSHKDANLTLEKIKKYASSRSTQDETVYLTSNLGYIRPLEYGFSKKAPRGMVRINFKRITNNLN